MRLGLKAGMAGAYIFPAAIVTESLFKRLVEFKRMFDTEARRPSDFCTVLFAAPKGSAASRPNGWDLYSWTNQVLPPYSRRSSLRSTLPTAFFGRPEPDVNFLGTLVAG